MHILWTILAGLAAGFIAKAIYPGREHMGWIVTTLLGIAGSFVATYSGQWLHLYQAGKGPASSAPSSARSSCSSSTA
jgi:uncharacterized membrane protein YeaQ/YmgE (transglycosylase-associated protein family)